MNRGVLPGRVEVFSLTGTSPKIGSALLPGPGDNFAVIDLNAVGVRLVDIGGGQFGVQFAINTFGERSHPVYPGGFEVDIDTNDDGIPDFAVYNRENGTFASTGQTLVAVQNLSTGSAAAYFYADADLNSGNMILTAPLSALGGLSPSTPISFYVLAYDNYFTGTVTDVIDTDDRDAGYAPVRGRRHPRHGRAARRHGAADDRRRCLAATWPRPRSPACCCCTATRSQGGGAGDQGDPVSPAGRAASRARPIRRRKKPGPRPGLFIFPAATGERCRP